MFIDSLNKNIISYNKKCWCLIKYNIGNYLSMYQKGRRKIVLTSLFEIIKEVYLCINFNWSSIVKDGVGNSTRIWLGIKFKNVSISTPLSEEKH